MPDQRVTDDLHLVLLRELEVGIRGIEDITLRRWVDQLPLHVVLGREAGELIAGEFPGLGILAADHASVECHAYEKVILIDLTEGWLGSSG